LIGDSKLVLQQVLKMVREGRVEVYTKDGTAAGEVALTAETICLHGDGEHAAEFAEMIHAALVHSEIQIQAPL
jgi:UPF0271 protein